LYDESGPPKRTRSNTAPIVNAHSYSMQISSPAVHKELSREDLDHPNNVSDAGTLSMSQTYFVNHVPVLSDNLNETLLDALQDFDFWFNESVH